MHSKRPCLAFHLMLKCSGCGLWLFKLPLCPSVTPCQRALLHTGTLDEAISSVLLSAESPAAGLPPRHSAPLDSNDSRRSLHSHRLPPIPSSSMQLQDSGGLDTPQAADGSEARRRWARLR